MCRIQNSYSAYPRWHTQPNGLGYQCCAWEETPCQDHESRYSRTLYIRGMFWPAKITAATADDSEYVPISPTPKKGYPIQLRLRSHTAWSRGTVVVCYPSLGPTSYLKIDEYYEVPIQMLQEATDRAGNPYVIYPKRQGGMAQLRDHVRNRDRIRSTSKSDHAGEETSLEGLKVERLKVEEHFLQTCWGVVTIAWTSLLQWFALHYVRD